MTFADFITATFAEPRTDSPEPRPRFKDPQAIHACITRLLPLCRKYDKCAGLADNLNNAAQPLHALWYTAGSPEAAQAADKVTRVAIDFENFLQLIASVRYAAPAFNDLLHGNDQHFGIFGSPLGQLLRSSLSPRRGGGPIPGKSIVTWDHRGKSPKDRCYALALDHRNAVHDAKALTTRDLMDHAQQVCMAFLFATEENLGVLQEGLFEFRVAMNTLIARCSDKSKRPAFYLPLSFAPMKKVSKGKYILDRSGADRVEQLETLQQRGHAASGELAVALLGEPGAGKSTVVHELALRQATAVLKAPFSQVRVPVLLEAKDVTEHRSLLQLVSSQLGCEGAEASTLAQQGRLLIVLDGLNELPSRLISTAKNELKTLAQEFPTSGFVVTSRGYVSTADLPFWHLRVRDLTLSDIRAYVKQVVGDDNEAAQFIADIESIPRLLKMCHTPLLLWMLTEISRETEPGTTNTHHVLRIPENTGRLLREFIRRFLIREQEQGNLRTEDGLSTIDPATLHDVLGHLALTMRERNEVATTQERCRDYISERLPLLQSRIGAVDVLNVARHAGILDVSGDDSVRFFHELVQEYFAASESVRRWRKNDASLRVLGDGAEWTETKKLFFGLLDPNEQSRLLPRLAETDVAGSATYVMDAIHPNVSQQQVIVRSADTNLRNSAAAASSSLLAYSRIWNDDARRRVLAYASTTSTLRDFLSQCTDEPIAKGLELLDQQPSKQTLGALRDVIAAHAPGGLEASIRSELCEVLATLLSKHSLEFGHPDVLSLFSQVARNARLPQQEQARDRVLAILCDELQSSASMAPVLFALHINAIGHDPRIDTEVLARAACSADLPTEYLTRIITACASRSTITQSELQSFAARVIIAGHTEDALPFLQRIVDKAWLHPWLGVIVDRLLEDRVDMTRLRQWLAQAADAAGARAAYLYLLNSYRMPPSGLTLAFEALGEDIDSSQVKADYLRRYLARQAYPDALNVLRMIPFGVLAASEFSGTVPQLRDRGEHILATDLEIKMRSSVGAAATDERVAAVIAETLRVPDELERHSYACRAWWNYMPDDVRRTAIRTLLANPPITSATIEGWPPAALNMLRGEHAALVAAGKKPHVERKAGNVIGIYSEHHELDTGDRIDATSPPASDLIESGEADADAVRRWHQRGEISDASLKRWISARLAAEDVEAALRVRTRENSNTLLPLVAEHIERFLSDEKYVPAGSLIVGYSVANDYLAVLKTVIPALLETDKPGLAQSLATALGPTYQPAFAELVGDVFGRHLREADYRQAESLVTLGGLAIYRGLFSDLVALEILRLLTDGPTDAIDRLVSVPALDRLRWRNRVRDNLRGKRHAISIKVLAISEKGFAFGALPLQLGKCFMHARVLGRAFDELEVGQELRCTVGPNERYPASTKSFQVVQVVAPEADSDAKARHRSSKRPDGFKAVGKGQERRGVLRLQGSSLAAEFEGDDRQAAIENVTEIPDRDSTVGKAALFYVTSVNKHDGIRVRFLRFL